MSQKPSNTWSMLFFTYSTLWLFAMVALIFGGLSDRFLTLDNVVNILIQSSSLGIIATGMTFVLLTAGIDLSVGSIMFLSAVVVGKIVLGDYPLPLAFGAAILIGAAYGALNGLMVTRFKILPFIVTLATLYLGRGLGLYLSETRAMNLPENLLQIGSARLFGVIPLPIVFLVLALAIAHYLLTMTPFGRQIYAIGNDIDAAQKAGINTSRVLFVVYVLCGLFAAIGGLVAVAQMGSVAPKFGDQREFAAISAAVLGGTSLFGGRGSVIPGTLLGAVLIQTIDNGLVIVNANPYIYPMVTSSVIFLAVLIDTKRNTYMAQLKRKKIRVD